MKIYVLGLVKVKKVALEAAAGIVTIQKVNVLVNVVTQNGEGKPKCLSKARAASLRSSGGKKQSLMQ